MMAYPPNAYAVGPPHMDASAALDPKGTALHTPYILTYRYGSRMICVATGNDYEQAIDIAVKSFPELGEFDRDRICLEARVLDGNLRTVEIGRSAWSFLVPMLPRMDIVDIRIASPVPPKSTATFRALPVEPSHPHDRDANLKGLRMDPVTAYGVQVQPHNSYSSLLSQLDSHSTRVMVDIITKSSRGRHSPQPPAF